eukprot:8737858-Alexandrium_andersonii.AAC.1
MLWRRASPRVQPITSASPLAWRSPCSPLRRRFGRLVSSGPCSPPTTMLRPPTKSRLRSKRNGAP